jgi:hypothetical protein
VLLVVYDVQNSQGFFAMASVVTAIRVASDCSVSTIGYLTADGIPIQGHEADAILWGHHDPRLSEPDADFVFDHFGVFFDYQTRERYCRVANALRLHEAALLTRNCDLALLGFVGSLESLFSIAPQELSFRLSLVIGNFLGSTGSQQREFCKRAHDLYSIRSKIAHGDKVADSEEAAAIRIVETWTPEAEELARLSLKRVFQKGITGVFDSKKEHERLLTELLFEGDLENAIRSIG